MIENVVSQSQFNPEKISLETQVEKLLIENKYSQIVSLCEQVINTEVINVNLYCYLVLAYLLQLQEEEAQATYILAIMSQDCSDKAEKLTEKLLQVLNAEAQRQADIENIQNTWRIRQYIREIAPNSINNLLYLIQISIKLNNFTPDFLKDWQVVEFMQLASGTNSIDVELLSQVFKSITEFYSQVDQEQAKTFNYLSGVYTNIEHNHHNLDILNNFSLPYKLHLGCGKVKFDGWLNIDLDATLSTVDFICDVSNGLPFENDSCQIIYNEHMLEHLPIEKGVFLLSECYRVLQGGGILRIAMPSLDILLEKANSINWRNQDWLTWPEYQFIQTRAEMINIAFRWWGHQWLYDREELYRRLHEAGFVYIKDVEWGSSEITELKNRETRKDSLLICEARK